MENADIALAVEELLPSIPSEEYSISIYRAAYAWLKSKYENKSRSIKTKKAYKDTLADFDTFLREKHLSLTYAPREVALQAQEWVHLSRVPGRVVSSSTINQRYAIISSFYKFAILFGACEKNPIDYCERPARSVHNDAPALDAEYIDECMKKIDTHSRKGKRDHTLLMLAFMTGRRLSELTGLQWKHIKLQGRKMTVTWIRCKGNKTMHDELSVEMTAKLLKFLQSEYGVNLERIAPESYVFQSHSNNNQGGRLSAQTLSQISLNRLGVSQFHTTRHSFAVNSEEAGYTLSETSEQLGHSNVATTAQYMKQKRKKTNKHTGKLFGMFGFEE